MSDQEDFDREITPFQEYGIAIAVILIFGAMYLFFMKGCQPSASSITRAINPQVAQVSHEQNQSQHLNNQESIAETEQLEDSAGDNKSVETSDQVSVEAIDSQTVANDESSDGKLEQAAIDEAATAAQKLADEKRFQEKQAELKAGSAELVIPAKPIEAASVTPEPAANTEAESSSTENSSESESAAAFNMADELARVNFTLPDGRKIQIPENGFESQFKQSILQESDLQTIVFDRVSFFSGSDLLNPESSNQILGVAGIMNTYKDIGIRLRGHTDSAGAAANNLTLSFKRSKNLRDQLVGLGIDTKRVQVEGLGSSEPISDNGSEKGRNKNRRIDLTIIR